MAQSSEATSRKPTTAEARQYREYFQRWKRVGPILDGIRFRELRAMTDEERVRSLTSVMACPVPRQADEPSGWLAWQKVRKQWMKRRESRTR